MEQRQITLTINETPQTLSVGVEESLLDALRRAGYFSVKMGCGDGICGVCTVLMDGKPIRSCRKLAVDAEGTSILTLEGLSDGQTLHPLQTAYMETGAIQCGYCTPGQIMLAKALLDQTPNPTEDEIRRALNRVLCRCTGYVRGVSAVARAAQSQQGKTLQPYRHLSQTLPKDLSQLSLPEAYTRQNGGRSPLPPLVFTPPEMAATAVVGQPEVKVDARKLALGRPVFTDDFQLPGMLYGALLTSPYAHARIRRIDVSKARTLPGVHAVLTHHDVPRVKFASAGQSYPQPRPYDQVSLDNKVRHVGDRVAVVAAETPEIARAALDLIEVDYEVLPAVVEPEDAMQPGAPVIHDEPDTEGIYDRARNIVHHIEAETGDVDKAFAEADRVFEGEYRTPKQQHVHLEPHACITYLDEDDRLVIRTSTQVPFHIRRMVAPLIGLPIKQIRVIKPRIGGGFGGKQELILEDLCAHLTLATRRPVRMMYTRKQEFNSARSRHPTLTRYQAAVKDGKLTALSLYLRSDNGAYGPHGLTVNSVGGFKALTLYNPPNARFISDVVYTNKPPSGAFRGYGATQCQFGLDILMSEIAEALEMTPTDFKQQNWITVGETMHLSEKLGERGGGEAQTLTSSGMAACLKIGMQAADYQAKRQRYASQTGTRRRGIGLAVVMHGSGIADMDMGAATLKMNDDGSFNLLIGATDLGTGSDTILGQIAAEVLGVPLEDIIVYSSDTDFTPFDKGAYASSTTYVSGGAVLKTAKAVRKQIQAQAALMLGSEDPSSLTLSDRQVHAPDGRKLTLAQVALNSLHVQNQHQIMATASHVSPLSPPPMAVQLAEVAVDVNSGSVEVERLLMVVDCGRVINPITAAGQVEGGMTQALGMALTEEMRYDEKGQPLNDSLARYRIPRAARMPALDVIFVETHEASGPFGAKSVSEISVDGVGPALASAIHNAVGVWLHEMPFTPERVKAALGK